MDLIIDVPRLVSENNDIIMKFMMTIIMIIIPSNLNLESFL